MDQLVLRVMRVTSQWIQGSFPVYSSQPARLLIATSSLFIEESTKVAVLHPHKHGDFFIVVFSNPLVYQETISLRIFLPKATAT